MKRIDLADLEYVAIQAKDSMRLLKNQNLFITGATGFFGKWILECLIYANEKHGANIRLMALSRDPEVFLKQHPYFQPVNFIKGDIRDFKAKDLNCSHVIHAAMDVKNANDLDFSEQNSIIVDGMKNTLNQARAMKCKRFLFTSSGAVYNAEANLNSGMNYGESKRVAELMGKEFAAKNRLDFVVSRCFAFVGPYLPLDIHLAIGNFINDAIHERNIFLKGDGMAKRSYMYGADLVVWLLKMLTQAENNTSYDVGSDEEISIYDLALLVKEVSGTNIQVERSVQPMSNNLRSRYIPNISRAKTELGLKIGVDIKGAIQKTIDFYKSAQPF